MAARAHRQTCRSVSIDLLGTPGLSDRHSVSVANYFSRVSTGDQSGWTPPASMLARSDDGDVEGDQS